MTFIKLKIETEIDAAPEKVWEGWTQPEHIVNWNFASPDWCCPHAENDLRVGGKFKSRMEAKDGSFGFDFEGIYDELVPLKKIGYHMEDGRCVETLFSVVNGKTKINTTFDAENENPLEMQQQGWQAILDQFKLYVSGL